MQDALRAKMLEILDANRIMTVATLRPDGWPQATTVGYAHDGVGALYFFVGRESQKAANIARDDRVSLTIDHDVADPLAITGLSMAARVRPVTDPAEIGRAFALLGAKYPEYVAHQGDFDFSVVTTMKAVPVIVSVLDYSRGFGHSDLVSLDAEAGRPAAA